VLLSATDQGLTRLNNMAVFRMSRHVYGNHASVTSARVRVIKIDGGTKEDTLKFLQRTPLARSSLLSMVFPRTSSYYFPSITLTRILFRFCPCKFRRLILIPPSRIPSPNPSALQSHSSFIASLSRSGFYAIFCSLTSNIIRSPIAHALVSLFFSEDRRTCAIFIFQKKPFDHSTFKEFARYKEL